MTNIQLVSDSSCDLHEEFINNNPLTLVPFYVSFDKENYLREGVDITADEFYSRMEEDKIIPKTSTPSTADYITVFEDLLEKKEPIICFTISSKFSGSFQAATNARNMVLEDHPDAQIHIMDSILCSGAEGLLVTETKRMMDADMSLEEILRIIDSMKQDACIHFTVNTLEYLQKGGRIGKASALAGSLLNVKPLISMRNGELDPYGIVRGKKKAMKKLVEMVLKDLEGKNKEDYQVVVGCIQSFDDIKRVKDELENEGFSVQDDLCHIGVTIGTYTGSTALGVGYAPRFETYMQ